MPSLYICILHSPTRHHPMKSISERKDGARNYRTVVCKFFLQNRCEKGDDCTFLHEIKDDSSISRKKEEHIAQKDAKKSERAGIKKGDRRDEMATLKERMDFLEKSLEKSKEKT